MKRVKDKEINERSLQNCTTIVPISRMSPSNFYSTEARGGFRGGQMPTLIFLGYMVLCFDELSDAHPVMTN